MSEYFTFNEYMKNNKLTPSEEDYVEMIYRINLNRGNVQVKDVANELNIKPASVTKMVKKLNDKDIVELDEERKAAMVSNLLVVLCGNKDAQPIVNSGSLY